MFLYIWKSLHLFTRLLFFITINPSTRYSRFFIKSTSFKVIFFAERNSYILFWRH